jgi:hypothetical protein
VHLEELKGVGINELKGPFLLLLDYVPEDTDVLVSLNLDSKSLPAIITLHPAVELNRACHFVDEKTG